MDWSFLTRNKQSLNVTTDSRKVTPGSVFVALKGEHFDGNAFVEQAREAGAEYIISGENALAELQDLARAWRRELGLPILGITGTNGKTTTKELCAAVLKTKYNLYYTQGNLNNQLGVPLTLLSITRAHELAIEEVPAGLKLVFPAGHPQNGCTYIQHPLQANLYFEVNEFHNSLLERKQNELLRVLESLGAYSARVEVRHEQREDTNREAELQRDGKGSYGVAKGSAAYSGSESRQALSAFSQSATKDWTFNPPPKPALPDDLVFYPTEETWKNLAASVLRGGLKRATVDLEYKSEYGVTEKRLSDISASAKIVLPSFEMHLKSSFSSNLHRLTTTQWHYEAIFEDEQGKRAGDEAVPSPETATMLPKTPDDKVEALFLKKAKRYAKSEGHIDSAQRADLEAFASKYGIDEFRMEELIEEAFEA